VTGVRERSMTIADCTKSRRLRAVLLLVVVDVVVVTIAEDVHLENSSAKRWLHVELRILEHRKPCACERFKS